MAASHTLNTSRREKTINLGAGPSSLPTTVLLEVAQGILDYDSTGIGLIELSHRSGTFKKVIEGAERDLRTLLKVPDDYAVLFTQGGGTEQFAATALNLLAAHATQYPDYISEHSGAGPPCDYVVTGSWSSKAMKEAARMGASSRAVVDARKVEGANGKFGSVPPVSDWQLSSVEERPAMLYYCDNETVDGVEFPSPGFPIQDLPEAYRRAVPLVADCSSNILSRPIDVASHALIFFGAQKNVGPSGVTCVIVRRSLLVDPDAAVPHGGPRIPTTLVYKTLADNNSLYNTPPMFAIYASALVFTDLLSSKGGVDGACERAARKSGLVYAAIDSSDGIYAPTVRQRDARSRMNVTFRICHPARPDQPDEALEARFVKRCAEASIDAVKGHRSVGGIRTSLYNAVTVEQVQILVGVMQSFAKEVLNEA